MKPDEVEAIALLAGIAVHAKHSIVNPYWPSHASYDDVRNKNPWWVLQVEGGQITIGWRKRVIAIDWSFTNRRGEITADDVTKSHSFVHAWSHAKAVEYLRKWKELPVVDVTSPGIKHFMTTSRDEMLQNLRICFDESVERELLMALVNTTPEDTNLTMTFNAGEGYYTAHAHVGDLSVALIPRVKREG